MGREIRLGLAVQVPHILFGIEKRSHLSEAKPEGPCNPNGIEDASPGLRVPVTASSASQESRTRYPGKTTIHTEPQSGFHILPPQITSCTSKYKFSSNPHFMEPALGFMVHDKEAKPEKPEGPRNPNGIEDASPGLRVPLAASLASRHHRTRYPGKATTYKEPRSGFHNLPLPTASRTVHIQALARVPNGIYGTRFGVHGSRQGRPR